MQDAWNKLEGGATEGGRIPKFAPLALLLLVLALGIALLPTTVLLGIGLALVGAVALILYPELALYALVFAVPFGSLRPLSLGGVQLTAADLLLVLGWMLYLTQSIVRRRFELTPPPLALPFVLFLFAAAVSITVASSLTDSVTELAKWIEMFAAYWLVAQFFDRARVERLLAVMLAAGLAQALLGIYQYYFRIGPEGFLLFDGANLRAYGTFEQPNPYAGYLGLILPLALGTILGILSMLGGALGQRRAARARAKVSTDTPAQPDGVPVRFSLAVLLALASVALAAMLAALFFSYSRGAWIGVAAGLGVTALVALVRTKRAAALALSLAAVGLIVVGLGEINLVPSIIADRFATVADYLSFEDVRGVRANDENFAIVERRAHWQAAFEMFEDAPVLGVGIGNYAAAYPRYALPKWEDPLGHAHNYYFNVLAEAGALGFVTYLVLWSAIFWQVGRAAWLVGGWQQGVAAGALGVLVALSIHNFFDNLFVHAMYIQVGLTLGMIRVLVQQTKPYKESATRNDRIF